LNAEKLQCLLGSDFHILKGSVEAAPAEKGAYALLLLVDNPLVFRWRMQAMQFDPGRYVYAGSARGAGGIRARLRHHLRRDKSPHWHVDHLTNQADTIDVVASIDGSECRIVSRLIGTGQFQVPIAGFGSSDCRGCPAHLLRFSQ